MTGTLEEKKKGYSGGNKKKKKGKLWPYREFRAESWSLVQRADRSHKKNWGLEGEVNTSVGLWHAASKKRKPTAATSAAKPSWGTVLGYHERDRGPSKEPRMLGKKKS